MQFEEKLDLPKEEPLMTQLSLFEIIMQLQD